MEDPILSEETTLSLLLRREAETHCNKIPIVVFVLALIVYVVVVIKIFVPMFYLLGLFVAQFMQ
jgi:hypothetical protein